ncbi:MAG: hypothetical protein GKR96_12825 [Gammaproteobacteria bacterium]|nr:hypothetical protein [Gammaproteobacteria bacterium]
MALKRRFVFVIWCGFSTFAFGGSWSDVSAPVPGWNALVYLIYKVEVTNYCSLTEEKTILGFQQKYKRLIEQYHLDRVVRGGNLIDFARSEAWNLAYKEWDNRGLGGFRGWCKKEASRYRLELEVAE